MWPWKTWCQIVEGFFLLSNNREAEAQPVAETWYVGLLVGKEAEAQETRDRRHVLGQIIGLGRHTEPVTWERGVKKGSKAQNPRDSGGHVSEETEKHDQKLHTQGANWFGFL